MVSNRFGNTIRIIYSRWSDLYFLANSFFKLGLLLLHVLFRSITLQFMWQMFPVIRTMRLWLEFFTLFIINYLHFSTFFSCLCRFSTSIALLLISWLRLLLLIFCFWLIGNWTGKYHIDQIPLPEWSYTQPLYTY